MKLLRGTSEQLIALDTRINTGLQETVQGYHAENYSEIQEDALGYFYLIDENDLRDPMQFLTQEELEALETYTSPTILEQNKE